MKVNEIELYGEAVFLEKVKDLQVIKQPIKADVGKSIIKGDSYIILSKTGEEGKRLMSNLEKRKYMFMPNSSSIIYIPYGLTGKVGTKMVKYRPNMQDKISEYKERIPNINKVSKISTEIKDFNVFCDLSEVNELIFKKLKPNNSNVVKKYIELVSKYFIKGSENTSIIIDLQKELDNVASKQMIKKSSYKEEETKTPFMYLMYLFKYELEYLINILDGMNMIFIGNKGALKYTFDKESEELDGDQKFAELVLLINKINTPQEALEIGEKTLVVNNDKKKVIIEDEKIIKSMTNAEVSSKISNELEAPVDNVALATEDYDKVLEDIKKFKFARTSRKTPKEEEFMKSMQSVNVNNNNASDLYKNAKKLTIEEKSFNITSLSGLDKNRFINFNKSYNEKLKEEDLVNIAKIFSKADIPLYVQKVELESSTDSMDYKERIKISFKDRDGESDSISVDMPKLLDDKFLFINGSKKAMINQLVLKPIVKVGDDVILTTNYNKAFTRFKGGKYLSYEDSKLTRGLSAMMKDRVKGFVFGDASNENAKLGLTTLEYNRISSFIEELKKKDIVHFIFDYKKALEEFQPDLNLKDITYETEYITIGKYRGSLIKLKREDDRIEVFGKDEELKEALKMMSLPELVLYVIEKEFNGVYEKYITKYKNIPSSIVGTHIKILSRDIPLILLLMHTEGLFTTLDLANIKYEIHPGEKAPKTDKYKDLVIKLMDGYLVIRKDSIQTTALVQPLLKLSLESFKISELEDKDTSTVIIEETLKSNNLPLYLDNYKTFMIDSITRDVLSDLNLPTEWAEVLLYCNMLLSTGINQDDQDLNNVRLRSAETITAALYNVLADSFGNYQVQKKRGSKRVKFNVSKNAVISKVMELPTVEEYSERNPIYEADRYLSATFKGLGGMNLDKAYKISKRLWNKSFYGVLSAVSSFSGAIGIVKRLSIDPKVISPRGYFDLIENDEDIDNVSAKSMMSPSEAITAGAMGNDDGQRAAMNMQQKGHIFGTYGSDVMLMSNGYDEYLAKTSVDFANTAKESGKVISIDANYIHVEYKDKTTESLPINSIGKNAAKASFIDNKHRIKKGLKVGSKFSEGDTLSANESYFTETVDGRWVFKLGPRLKVALHSMPETYEDSTILSKSSSRKLSTNVPYNFSNKIPANAKIYGGSFTLGKEVRAGEVVMKYSTMTIDEEINKFLEMDDLEDLNALEKTFDKTGTVMDIRIFYACEIEEMSETLQALIKNVKSQMNKISGKNYSKYSDKETKELFDRLPKKVKANSKINGTKILKGEVLIEVFLNTVNVYGNGDKITYHSALKGITGSVVEDDMMPVTAGGEKIDAVLSVISPLSRKVDGFYLAGLYGRAASKLQENLAELLEIELYKD